MIASNLIKKCDIGIASWFISILKGAISYTKKIPGKTAAYIFK